MLQAAWREADDDDDCISIDDDAAAMMTRVTRTTGCYFLVLERTFKGWKRKKFSALRAELINMIFPIRIFDPNANDLSSNSVLVSLQLILV
uniref:Uncharacterized protein n=1 Tax=Romanomermis culicivorax TaxID=13658 RepID=A0A915J152_ROMCU